MKLWEQIKDLAGRVDRNVPRHGDPERFHTEKSEISHELKKLGDKLERGSKNERRYP
jgi:hypothetical protein